MAAGSPILAQEHIDQTFYVEPGLFQRKPDYLLKVRGMSMRDVGIMDGDLLAVQQAKEAKNGQIVVARLGDEVTVKRFRRLRNTIELLPENPDLSRSMRLPAPPLPESPCAQTGCRATHPLSTRQAVRALARGLMGGLLGVLLDAVLPEPTSAPPPGR